MDAPKNLDKKRKPDHHPGGLLLQRGEMPIGQVLIIAFVTIPLVMALVVFGEGAIDYLAEAVEKFLAP